MSSQNQRVNKGIASLVRRLLGDIPGEDPAATEERENNAVLFVREVLEKYSIFYTIILASANTFTGIVREVQRLTQM
jgi:hypothetical protein